MPEIAGPRGPIPYTRDALGYPSVQARDRLDAAFAHGFLIATDRLVQVHLTVLAGEGRLLEVLGDTPVARTLDRVTRAFDFAGDAEAEAARLGPEMRALCEAWCAGFDAGATARGRPWPLRVLGQPVRKWTARDMVVLYRIVCFFGLTSIQAAGEVALTELLATGGGRDLAELLLGDAADGVHPEAVVGADLTGLGWLPPVRLGSNAVAVAAARSATGHAMLWGQPHMEVGHFPPTLYAIHLAWEGGGVTGVGIPGVPWLSYVRTPAIAVAYTYGHADNVDILVQECRDGAYRDGDAWRPLRRRASVVKVRGKADETFVFWDAPYGVVLGDASKPGRYPCLRWSGLRGPTCDFDAIPRIEAARTVEEALDAHRGLRAISLHAVVADASGRIGYTLTGQVDRRPEGWSGAGPAGGEVGRAPEPLPESCRPRVTDPPEGFLVSANERRDGPDGSRWVTLPEPRWRHDQLTRRLAGLDRVAHADVAAAMHDETDLCAATLLSVWRPLLDDAGFQALCDWAGRPDHPDRDAMLSRFHALHAALIERLVAAKTGDGCARAFVHDLDLVLQFQWHLDKLLALEEPARLDASGLATLLAACWPAAREGHPDVPVRARFTNTILQGKLPSFLGFDSPEVRFPGGPVSPFQTRRSCFRGETFLFGPGTNFVVDFGVRGIRYNLPGGASERRFGPGYGRGIDGWLRGDLLPLGG